MQLANRTREFLNSFWSLLRLNAWKLTKILTVALLLGIGLLLLHFGLSQHNAVTYESPPSAEGIVITTDNDTVIQSMTIYLNKEAIRSNQEGWMYTTIEFNSSCQSMYLAISLPTRLTSAISSTIQRPPSSTESSYNESLDSSFLFTSYVSSEETTRIRISFDWKVCEKMSYDQERISISFSNPYFGLPLFREILHPYGVLWVPKIDLLTIQVQAYNSVDFSSTSPQPSYSYVLDGKSSVY